MGHGYRLEEEYMSFPLKRTMKFLFLAAALGAATLTAQEMLLDFDPALTTVGYTLGDVLHTVHGSFQLKRGQIHFDVATGKASGELIVDAASGTSGSNARDGRMHKNILESGKYPEIAFRPDRVEGTVAPKGTSQVKVHGLFAIHGAEHEVSIPAEVRMEPGQATAILRFPVPYVKWGMKNPSTFLLRVKDTVEIEVKTVAHFMPSMKS
jgi:polyisoprenoid-binding protein YceI